MPNPASFTFLSNLADLPDLKPDSILSQTIHNDDSIKVTLFHFDKGQSLTQHTSSKAAVVQILKGQALLGLGDESIEASEGSWLHMPANLPHSVNASSQMVMLLTLLKS